MLLHFWYRQIASISLDAAAIGVIGTLLGAVVGGIFTLIGSVYVNKRQQHAQFDIKRKNIIYKPIYDELVDIKENILSENPYPNYIVFSTERQGMYRIPQYTAWGRIKNDSRYLETPEVLKEEMESLYKTIHRYIGNRSRVGEEVGNIFKQVLKENGTGTNIVNIGDSISGHILSEDNYDLCDSFDFHTNDKGQIPEVKRKKINQETIMKANNCMIVKDTRAAYKEMLNQQDKTIDLLSKMIEIVTFKYEA